MPRRTRDAVPESENFQRRIMLIATGAAQDFLLLIECLECLGSTIELAFLLPRSMPDAALGTSERTELLPRNSGQRNYEVYNAFWLLSWRAYLKPNRLSASGGVFPRSPMALSRQLSFFPYLL